MENITPHAILRQHGKWITASEFVDLVCNKREVKPRQAKNIISEAYRKKEIIKHIFSDRTVIYGIPEFGPPTFENPKDKETVSSDFYNSLVFQFWKEREEVQQLLLRKMPFSAWRKTRDFAGIVSSSTKNEQLAEEIKKVNEDLVEIGNKVYYVEKAPFTGKPGHISNIFYEKEQRELLDLVIPKIWEQISVALSNP